MLVELTRHGETVWQRERRYQGARSDVALSEQGVAALVPADTIPPCVYVTPLVRTSQTAAAVYPGAEQLVVPGLAEMDFGDFEGRSAAEMESDPAYRRWVDGGCEGTCPGGESRAAFCERACAAFASLLDGELARGTGAASEPLTFVVHGGTIMAVLERFAHPAHPYFDWHVGCGHGYLLDASAWCSERRLRVLGAVDHTRRQDGRCC